MHRLLCSLSGGHRWLTRRDAAGDLTSCARCGTLRHARVESARHGQFKVHMNLAAEFRPLAEHGREELDAPD